MKHHDYSILVFICIMGLGLATIFPGALNKNHPLVPPSVVYEVVPNLKKAHDSVYTVLNPQNNRAMGAATIIQWRPGKKILAISAYHVFEENKGPHLIGISSHSPTGYYIVWAMGMRVIATRPVADLVLLESLEVARVYGTHVNLGKPMLKGSRVWAIGAPRGYQRAITAGIISHIHTSRRTGKESFQ